MDKVLVTGGSGTIGHQVVRALADHGVSVISVDIRPPDHRVPGVTYDTADVGSSRLVALMDGVEVVVHLAAVVTPRPGQTRDDQYRIDVEGTRNVLRGCATHGVRKLVYTSSGAAYGYSPRNGALLFEGDVLRGNREFAYAWHKRLVEEMLADWRESHPELQQLVFRVSTVLGASVHNQITALFERPVVLGIRDADTPFCFVWDHDVVDCIVAGVLGEQVGVFNLTGDGAMTLREIAAAMGRRYLALPEPVLRLGLAVAHDQGWTSYGPEQTLFLRHRPVLANERLKEAFGRPLSTREVFERYRSSRG